jgi:hypothetical protein
MRCQSISRLRPVGVLAVIALLGACEKQPTKPSVFWCKNGDDRACYAERKQCPDPSCISATNAWCFITPLEQGDQRHEQLVCVAENAGCEKLLLAERNAHHDDVLAPPEEEPAEAPIGSNALEHPDSHMRIRRSGSDAPLMREQGIHDLVNRGILGSQLLTSTKQDACIELTVERYRAFRPLR